MSSASAQVATELHWQWLGPQEYEPLWRRMQRFTDERGDSTPDTLWLCEHPPVFTLGLAAKPEHVLDAGDIPLVKIDRGGEVTYHGPGQLMIYPLIDIRRSGMGIRELVCVLEKTVIAWCEQHDVAAYGRRDAPGVYCGEKKLASIGLRIRRGASYHGLALNVDMDLSPFSRINPCGFKGLEMTDLRLLGLSATPASLAEALAREFAQQAGYTLNSSS